MVWPLLCVGQSTNWFESKHSNTDKKSFVIVVFFVHMDIKITQDKCSLKFEAQQRQHICKF